jgi:hypothetical protein
MGIIGSLWLDMVIYGMGLYVLYEGIIVENNDNS